MADEKVAALLRMDTDSDEEEENASEGRDDGGGIDAVTADRLVVLRDHLKRYPQSYEGHAEYVELLRGARRGLTGEGGEAEEVWRLLSSARESFAEEFPLNETLWLEWAKDCVEHGDGLEVAAGLLERAVADYPTPAVWKERLVTERGAGRGEEEVRRLAEEAVLSCGLHVAEGATLWEEYAQFEEGNLKAREVEGSRGEAGEQRERVRKVYKRCLGTPLQNLDKLHERYRAFEGLEAKDPSPLADAVEASVKELEARAIYERGLASPGQSDEDAMLTFQKYLRYENKYGSPTRVLSVFQRLVCRFPCSDTCWDAFGKYVEGTLKSGKEAGQVYRRAARNCHWTPQFWISALVWSEGPDREDLIRDMARRFKAPSSGAGESITLCVAKAPEGGGAAATGAHQEKPAARKAAGKKKKREAKKAGAKTTTTAADEPGTAKSKSESGAEAGGKRVFLDQCTLFVKNLPHDVSEGGLTSLLGGGEIVQECRLVLDRYTGKPKGFAYVDCKSEECLQKALEKDGADFSGRKIFVARSKPTKKRPRGEATAGGNSNAPAKAHPKRSSNPLPLMPRKVKLRLQM
ncbi:RRM domain-containing protein [Chloropicon primus]|uniref:RRM domain-containing protein n=2 Tax=Chloropicon primus TaxID=1764295 RepID=A0A5B8MCK2_9CHLO|nr:hypothetical protein A3770_01p07660 [Chloropicon primus]UPQ97459.1 RRM domain-containing protein [Chloropicon primus]|eukprot:QDZ18248.1 hypothetical protein A3770_01p07660 [Chloropicon primus]